MENLRIATIKKNGRRYFLQRIDFTANRAYLWGEIRRYKGLKTWHAKGFSVPLKDIDWMDVEKSEYLCSDLFKQYLNGGVGDGKFKIVGESGRIVKTYHLEKSNLHKLTDEIRGWVLSGEISEKEGFELMKG